jgi:hypothetical protein
MWPVPPRRGVFNLKFWRLVKWDLKLWRWRWGREVKQKLCTKKIMASASWTLHTRREKSLKNLKNFQNISKNLKKSTKKSPEM